MSVIKDHAGVPVTHGREFVNGVRLHYMKAGTAIRCTCCTECRRPLTTGVMSSRC